MEQKFYMMCGPAGSGKSTIAQRVVDEQGDDAILISTDQIRKDFFDSEETQAHNSEVFDIARTMVQTSLALGFQYVIFDATNLTPRYRKTVLNWLEGSNCVKIAVVVNPGFEVCCARNKARSRHVPEDVIRRQCKRYVEPTEEEGFDAVLVYS